MMNKKDILDGEKLVANSIRGLIFLGVLKFAVGYITGLDILIADAVTTFADTLGVMASYFGLRLSRKSADKKFKYGYYKIETFSALLVSFGIIYAGYAIFMNALANVKNPILTLYMPLGFVVTFISIYFSIRLEKKLRIAGEKVNSLSLLANAKDKKMDIWAGVIILVALFANYKNIPYVESVVTMGIVFLILKVGFKSAKDSLFFLLDYWDNPKLTAKIRDLLNSDKEIITHVNNIKLRHAGTYIFGEAYIEINPYADMNDLREELNILNSEIKKLNPYIKNFAIYTHIADKKRLIIGFPIKCGDDLDAEIANSVPQINAYIFVKIINKKIHGYYIRRLTKKDKTPENLSIFIKKHKVNILINSKLHSMVYYNLNQLHHIMIYPNFADVDTVRKTLKLLLIDI